MTGAGVRAIRLRLGLSQAGLAAIVGVDRECVARWESVGDKRLRVRSRAEEILIIVADFPADGPTRAELRRHLRDKRPLRALKLILDRGEGTTVAVV